LLQKSGQALKNAWPSSKNPCSLLDGSKASVPILTIRAIAGWAEEESYLDFEKKA